MITLMPERKEKVSLSYKKDKRSWTGLKRNTRTCKRCIQDDTDGIKRQRDVNKKYKKKSARGQTQEKNNVLDGNCHQLERRGGL